MAYEKPVLKISFCFNPLKLKDFLSAFEILKITKTKAETKYTYEKITTDVIQLFRRSFPIEVNTVLDNFTYESLKFQASEHTKFFKKQKSGASLEQYLSKAMNRDLQKYFIELANVQDSIAIYHKTINSKTNNLLTAPCKFSDIKPKIWFEVIKLIDGSLSVLCWVNIEDKEVELSHFNRNNFLLEYGNVYYFLSAADAQILDWLQETKPERYGKNPAQFTSHIIKQLELKYLVKKEGVFEKKVIEVEPVNCILLSEINSGSFLMLTPQWKYEDVLLEGEFKDEHEITIAGELYCIKRSKEKEEEFVNTIKGLHPNFTKQFSGYFYLPFEEAKKKNWFLKTYHKLLDENVELIGMDMLRHFRYSQHAVKTDLLNIKTTDFLIEADIEISFGDEKVNPNEIQKILYNNQKNILLKDNSIGVLDDEWITNYSAVIKHSKIEKGRISFPQWLLISAREIAQLQELKLVIDVNWWQKWQQWQDVNQTVYEVPKIVQATLRPYQQKGYEWMKLLSEIHAGVCLADDMGLGKTLQTICFLASQFEQQPDAKFIIVCPGSLIYNWQQELQKFCPSLTSFVYYGNNRKMDDFIAQKSSVLITAYSTLRADVDKLKNVFWNTIVLDESHNIKTLYAQATKAVYQVIAKHKIALSGTPIINNTFDLYAQLNYLLPGFLGSQEFFRKEYVLPIDRNKNTEKIEALHKLTNPFILRRTKAQVAKDLPEKTELVLWCEMEESQQEVYDSVKESIRKSVFLNIKNEGLNKSKLSVLQGIIKLRQVCCSPLLLKEELTGNIPSVKIDVLLDELMNNLSNNKVLVFSQFKEMLHLIAARLEENNISFFHFDGDTKLEERRDLVAKFQEEQDTTNVFLMSLKTGNAGITLTAADYVFLVDPWWNAAIEQQAIDRTHRIGQTKNVFAYKMICRNTIEEKIIEIQQRKQVTSDALISEEDGFVKNLTQDDIAYLFE
jgi:SNF2 family DNA or RNA helicase